MASQSTSGADAGSVQAEAGRASTRGEPQKRGGEEAGQEGDRKRRNVEKRQELSAEVEGNQIQESAGNSEALAQASGGEAHKGRGDETGTEGDGRRKEEMSAAVEDPKGAQAEAEAGVFQAEGDAAAATRCAVAAEAVAASGNARPVQRLNRFAMAVAAGDRLGRSAGSRHRQDGAANALHDAIRGRQEATALDLLRQPLLPGLNEVEKGRTALEHSIRMLLSAVAVAILARGDFTQVNTPTPTGSTSLHSAVLNGLLDVCHALLRREDFTEALALNRDGRTALELARLFGHHEIAALLEGAG